MAIEYTDISNEIFREYVFPRGEIVRIDGADRLNVSSSGGHRIIDGAGMCHYVPAGWIHLRFRTLSDRPGFAA